MSNVKFYIESAVFPSNEVSPFLQRLDSVAHQQGVKIAFMYHSFPMRLYNFFLNHSNIKLKTALSKMNGEAGEVLVISISKVSELISKGYNYFFITDEKGATTLKVLRTLDKEPNSETHYLTTDIAFSSGSILNEFTEENSLFINTQILADKINIMRVSNLVSEKDKSFFRGLFQSDIGQQSFIKEGNYILASEDKPLKLIADINSVSNLSEDSIIKAAVATDMEEISTRKEELLSEVRRRIDEARTHKQSDNTELLAAFGNIVDQKLKVQQLTMVNAYKENYQEILRSITDLNNKINAIDSSIVVQQEQHTQQVQYTVDEYDDDLIDLIEGQRVKNINGGK